jgi:hypothetical protein
MHNKSGQKIYFKGHRKLGYIVKPKIFGGVRFYPQNSFLFYGNEKGSNSGLFDAGILFDDMHVLWTFYSGL